VPSLRPIFAKTLSDLGAVDENLVVIVGDISHGLLGDFRNSFPSRYFNIGICEPAMIGVAAGMSKIGLNPVIHTIAPFLIERAYEQIKLDFGYQKISGNFVSVGSAFDYSKLGCSHHSYADVSLISHLPDSQVFLPGSPLEFEILFQEAYKQEKINYFRLTENSYDIEIERKSIQIGKGIKLRDGSNVTIITTGAALRNCILAADELEDLGQSVEVLYFPTIKPFDDEIIRESLRKTRKFISVEELSSHDGLYNLVLKASAGLDGIKSQQLAISEFISGYGTYAEIQARAGLAQHNIVQAGLKLAGD
jgi:transketolase